MDFYLIIGAHGFLGSALTKKLISKGKQVTLFDRNLHSRDDLIRFIKKSNVVYFLSGIKDSNDPEIFSVNVNWFESCLRLVSEYSPDMKLIFASSVAVYKPVQNQLTLKESSEILPRNRYGLTKLLAEDILKYYSDNKLVMSGLSLRISNIYGPTKKKDTSIVSRFMNHAKRGEIITLDNGGEQSRDFVYIDDVVAALIKAEEASIKGFDVFNISSDKSITLIELASLIGRITRTQILTQTKVVEGMHDDFWKVDNNKAKRILRWIPKVDLEEGLRGTWEDLG